MSVHGAPLSGLYCLHESILAFSHSSVALRAYSSSSFNPAHSLTLPLALAPATSAIPSDIPWGKNLNSPAEPLSVHCFLPDPPTPGHLRNEFWWPFSYHSLDGPPAAGLPPDSQLGPGSNWASLRFMLPFILCYLIIVVL